MKQTFTSRLLALLAVAGTPLVSVAAPPAGPNSIYAFSVKGIDGDTIPLSTYKGKVLLIVNVASKCGYTPQYRDLETLYTRYRDSGLVILGFPANNFRQQEPGTDAEIKSFCSTTYGVTFPMFSKISVQGEDQHPLYRYLTAAATNPGFSGDVKWNFTKYLIDRRGNIVGKFDSPVKPLSDELVSAVTAALHK